MPAVDVGVEPPSNVPLNESAPKLMVKVPLDSPPPSAMQVLVLRVKLPRDEYPTVLDGLIDERNGNGAQLGSVPTRLLMPVTVPVNGNTSALAGNAPVSSVKAMAVRRTFRIFSSPALLSLD
jgi:hypothetical protein